MLGPQEERSRITLKCLSLIELELASVCQTKEIILEDSIIWNAA